MDEERLRRRSARVALLVTGSLLLGLIVSSGRRGAWPFAYWKMYSAIAAKPARSVSVQQLVARDELGNVRRVWPKDLFTLDDESSQQPSGPAVIRAALRGGKQQRAHQDSLVRRVENVIGQKVREVEVRELQWKVHFGVHPTIDKDKPDAERSLMTLEQPR